MKGSKGAFVIAGGSRGLSRAIAAQAHRDGFPIALVARTRKDLLHAKMELESMRASTQPISVHIADLSNESAANRAFREILAIHKRVEVLVNNAATWTGGKTILKLTKTEVARSLDLNFFTAFNSTKAVLSQRRTPKAKLTIINMGATSSLQGWDHVFAFCAGKGALRMFSQSLARELQPSGVHVAHIIIDGLIANTRTLHINPKLARNRFMSMDSIATSVIHLVGQEKSCWTFEMDLRPHNENW